jgi:hypothetical protein
MNLDNRTVNSAADTMPSPLHYTDWRSSLSRKLFALAVTIGMVGTALVGGAATANAAGARTSDAKNDVFVYDWLSDDADYGWWNPDISSVSVKHSTNRVITKTRFHRLGAYPWDYFQVFLNTDGDAAPEYRYELDAENGNRGVYRGKYGFRKICDVKAAVNKANDVVTISAPRKCIGSPRGVSGKAEFWSSWGSDCCEDWATDWTKWTSKARRG